MESWRAQTLDWLGHNIDFSVFCSCFHLVIEPVMCGSSFTVVEESYWCLSFSFHGPSLGSLSCYSVLPHRVDLDHCSYGFLESNFCLKNHLYQYLISHELAMYFLSHWVVSEYSWMALWIEDKSHWHEMCLCFRIEVDCWHHVFHWMGCLNPQNFWISGTIN